MSCSQNKTSVSLAWRECISIASVLIGAYASYRYYKLFKTRDIPRPKEGIEELIGNTPLVKIRSLTKATGVNIYAKLELCNPAGSAKDRVALNIIKTAEELGELVRGEPGWVFEGTSGSTGISIAVVCNALGYRHTFLCPMTHR